MTPATKPTASDDYARIVRLVDAIAPDAAPIRACTIAGQPYSKARPRFAGGRAYNSEKQRAQEEALSLRLKAAFREPMHGNVAVVCLFYRKDHGRIDVDNLTKQVLDAANGVCWTDDMQVTAIVALLELDRERPRTVVAIAAHTSSLSRAAIAPVACRHCGGPITPHAHTVDRKYCSLRCVGLATAKVTRLTVACRHCQKPFERSGARRVYCSDVCRLAGLHQHNRIRTAAECLVCHKPLPNPHARLCRDCWRKNGGKLSRKVLE